MGRVSYKVRCLRSSDADAAKLIYLVRPPPDELSAYSRPSLVLRSLQQSWLWCCVIVTVLSFRNYAPTATIDVTKAIESKPSLIR